jgi:hypothetical protein
MKHRFIGNPLRQEKSNCMLHGVSITLAEGAE